MPQDVVDQLLALPEDRQRSILNRLTQPEKENVLKHIQTRQAGQQTLLASRRDVARSQAQALEPAFQRPENYRAWQAPLDFAIGLERATGIQPMDTTGTQYKTATGLPRTLQTTELPGGLVFDPAAIYSLPKAGLGILQSLDIDTSTPQSTYQGVSNLVSRAGHGLWNAIERGAHADNPVDYFQALGEARAMAEPFREPAEAGLRGANIAAYKAGLPSASTTAVADIGTLRARLNAIGQGRTGQVLQQKMRASPRTTTERAVAGYTKKFADATEAQAAAEQAAREGTQANFEKARDTAKKATQAAEEAARKAKTAEFEKARDQAQKATLAEEKARTAKQTVARKVEEANQKAATVNTRIGQLQTLLDKGSAALKPMVTSLQKAMKATGDAKYAAFREKVGGVTVPFDEVGDIADAAKQVVAGSEEANLKVFKDIERKALVREKGMTPDDVSIEDMLGYSREIGNILTHRNLVGDVYTAFRDLKTALDERIKTVAEEHEALPEFEDAQSYWANYRELFFNPSQALTKTLDAINENKNTPEFFDAFRRSKADDAAIANLRNVTGDNAEAANALANHLDSLRRTWQELDVTKPGTVKEVPPVPPPPTSTFTQFPFKKTTPPAPPTVTPFQWQPETPRPVTFPEELTPEGLRAMKKERVGSRAEQLFAGRAGFSYYPRSVMMRAVTAPIRWTQAGIIQFAPVFDALTQLTDSDLRAIDQLPESARTNLRNNILAARRVRPGLREALMARAPNVMRMLGLSAVTTQEGPANRREAFGRLGRNPENPAQ
jgi:hypothetical protein